MTAAEHLGISDKIAETAAGFLEKNRLGLIKEMGLRKTGKKPTLYLKKDGLYRKEKGAYAKYHYDLSTRPMRRKLLLVLAVSDGKSMTGKMLKMKVGSTSLESVYQEMSAIKNGAPNALHLTEELIVPGPNKGYRLNYRMVVVDKS